MKALVVYDSMYGNTEKIAQAIGAAITGDVQVLRASEVKLSELEELDLLIVGSPTQGARPTTAVQEFINKINANSLNNVKVTSFDTRFSVRAGSVGIRIIARMAGGFSYAARHIADNLIAKGGHLIIPSEGFIVKGTKGLLKEGELERAASWVKEIV